LIILDSRLRGNDNIVGFVQLCKALNKDIIIKITISVRLFTYLSHILLNLQENYIKRLFSHGGTGVTEMIVAGTINLQLQLLIVG
jgi:hypothetical protein